MKKTEYRIIKLANIAMLYLIKYKDLRVSMAHEFSEQPEIDIKEIMEQYVDYRREIYKLAGWYKK